MISGPPIPQRCADLRLIDLVSTTVAGLDLTSYPASGYQNVAFLLGNVALLLVDLAAREIVLPRLCFIDTAILPPVSNQGSMYQ